MRPNGLGDLQKGERYANMDYIVMAALAGFSLMLLTISYNIACHCAPLDDIKLQCALPVWHAGSHNEDCRDANSLSFKPALQERWGGRGAHLVGPQSRGAFYKRCWRGQRADILEGKIDNTTTSKTWAKVSEALQRKLFVAIAERDRQINAFAEVNKTIDSKVKTEWKGMIDAWLKDGSQPNPYTLNRKGREALAAAGMTPLHGRSATRFWRRIITERGVTVLVAADRENKIQEWRHALLVKVSKRYACVPGLVDMEAKLRVAQCDNSLVALRARLHAKRFLIGFRNENVAGQVQATKARTLIGQVGERAESYAEYRKGRRALVLLKGVEAYTHLRELKADDMRLDGDWVTATRPARKKLSMIGAGALDDAEAHLHDCNNRVEWARARSRKIRWSEEVMLLREEMRRVLRYLGWQETWAGARVYAMKEAAWHGKLAAFFRTKWDISAMTTAQQLVAVEDVELDRSSGSSFLGNRIHVLPSQME
ncbi:hypothetical protein B0H13DRAFT_2106465 [Mycena leptocephala]|nr:hypothetical protein B0H13DRAFT_2106465 [Mycena leptocephala]